MNKVIIIGGGAAGMTAAAAAAENGCRVILLEKNEKLGKKIYITGKGRCNFTNACDINTFLENIIANPKFMYSSLRAFGPYEMIDFLEENGCPTKVERGQRAFPLSDHASDVTKALEKCMRENGVDIELNTEVRKIDALVDGSGYAVTAVNVKNGKRRVYHADSLIIATGGLSYPSTGSTGDGYRFAESLGLTVKPLAPALVPVTVEEADAARLSGVSLKNVTITALDIETGKQVYESDTGEMLFTHFGLSGPLILSFSAKLSHELEEGKKYRLNIDLKPGLTREKLDERILRDFDEAKNTDVQNAISKLIISSLRLPVLKQAGIDPHKKVRDIKKTERKALLDSIKGLSFTVNGTRGYNEAVVTSGGVSIKEIDPKTMEVKGYPGLYFAGEVVDVHGYTGGFNIGAAAAMGHAAGTACARR